MHRPHHKDYVAQGYAAEREGRLADAARLYRKAIREGDDYSFNNLAQLLIEQNRLTEGEKLFRRGAKAGDSLAARNLVLFLLEQGREADAKRALAVAQRLGAPPTRRDMAESRSYFRDSAGES